MGSNGDFREHPAMTKQQAMPEWPTCSRKEGEEWEGYWPYMAACYEARLRVAVGALKQISAYDPGKFRPLADEIAIYEAAQAALREIGEVP